MPTQTPTSAVREAAPARSAMRGHPWLTLISVGLGVFMVGLDGSVVAIANPKIAEDLHASLSALQWITNAYLLGLAALLILGGKLGDRLGRRRMFFIGVVGFALASVGIGLIGSTAGVITLRALQGVFGALLMPNTLAILRSTFPPDKLNAAIGIWGGFSAISAALGPIVGGVLVEHVSWESVFYINAPIALIALIIGGLTIRESRSEADEHNPDLPGIVTLSGGMFLMVFGLVKAQAWGWGDAKTLGFIVGGLLVLALFVLIELRTPQPMLPMRLFANRSLSVGTVVVLINFFAMMGVMFFMTLYLESVQGLSPVAAGVRMLPISVTLIISASIGGFVTEKLGPRIPMVVGMIAVAIALALLTQLEATSSYGALWPAFVLLGIGIGWVMTASSEAIVGNAPVDDAGVAGGLQSTATQLGGVIGTAVLGSVLSSRVGSVLVDKLIGAGTPSAVATQLKGTTEYVAQGVAPTVPGASPAVQHAVTVGSHDAFITGLHTSMEVGIIAAVVGAALSLLVSRRVAAEGTPTVRAIHV